MWRLNERQRNVLERRLGIGGPRLTLSEVGEALGISRERVRQIEGTTLRDMAVGFDLHYNRHDEIGCLISRWRVPKTKFVMVLRALGTEGGLSEIENNGWDREIMEKINRHG